MGSLESTLREENTVISDDSNLVAIQVTKSCNQSISIVFFEFMETTTVKDSRENCVHVERLLMVNRDNAVEIRCWVEGFFWLRKVLRVLFIRISHVDILYDSAGKLNGMLFIVCQVVSHSRLVSVEMSATEFFVGDNFACSGLNQRGSTKEDCTLSLNDDDLIRHGRDVGTTSRAGTHYHCNLRDTFGRHSRLIVENLAKMIFVGEDIILLGQEGTSRIYQVNAGQVVLFGNLLRPNVLLHSDRIVSTTLESEVIGNDHALSTVHISDASNNIS